jgi:4-amino-4-deoxy-L-arabinose transferase-like glycosyltransferase
MQSGRRRCAGPLLGLAVGAAMLAWTWGTWPDVMVDFGGELYVPWRLAQGDVLYRDVAYFTGPLSPYLNAGVFRVLGTSFLALVIANLAVLAGIAVLLHRLVARIAGELAAAAASVVFLTLFAFAQLESIGNSNYVCPYSHETTHGALIALLALTLLERGGTARVLSIGFLVGLAFLTKVEVFLAVAGAAGLGLALGIRAGAPARTMACFAAGAVVPVAIAFVALCTAMPAGAALHGTLGAWPYTLDGRVSDLAFYRWVLGTDRPGENAGRLAIEAGKWLLCIGPGAAIAFLARRRAGFLAAAAGVAAAILLLLAVKPSPDAWIEAARPLPLFALLLLVPPLAAAWRASTEPGARRRAIVAACFGLYAVLMLAKMVLHARINMYGFALAMPATMLVVAALTSWIPAWIERAGGSGSLFRGFALGALGVAIFAHLGFMHVFLAQKTVVVGQGKDAFRADARGLYVNAAVAAIRSKLRPGGTLAAMPEGIVLNYLARAKAPARYINYMPPEVLMFGEERILADFREHPPDLVAIVHKPTAEYGLPWFGVDYGANLMAFVRAWYAPSTLIGGEPLRGDTRFGIRLLERGK